MLELFEQQVKLTPHAIAVVFGDKHWSYQELNARANQLAHVILDMGLGHGSLIGIGIDRSNEMVMSMLAVLKTGAAFVPLDPAYPAERLKFMMEHSKLSLVLTQESLKQLWQSFPTIIVDNLKQHLDISQSQRPNNIIHPETLAYVIYTSGSTGLPKGVMGHHRGLVNLAHVQKQTFRVGLFDRVLQFASLSFDAATWEISMALTSGATLVLAERETLTCSNALSHLIKTQQITIVTLSPTMLSLLNAPLKPLRLVISAGEACSEELVKKWSIHTEFVNAYGPTETTVCATLNMRPSVDGRPPSIGHPIANHRVYLLDDNQNVVPKGESGEIYIAGAGLAHGYLNDASLTEKTFVADPFFPGERMYKSGDRGRFRDDGELEFLGRMDHQIKLRGYRIELGEIEAALLHHPDVRATAVVLKKDRLVAYVASKKSSVSLELREHLVKALPDHMIPAAFIVMTELPLTPNGKIDRLLLQSIDSHPMSTQDYVAPRNATENLLAEIWCRVFHIDVVGIHDNFFELGGHSLLAASIVAEIKSAIDVIISLNTFFNAPTIAKLAEMIIASPKNESETSSSISRRKSESHIPLTPEQSQIWFASLLSPSLTAFNIPIGLELFGNLNRVVLEQSLNKLLERHEILRSCFPLVGGQPSQTTSVYYWKLHDIALDDLSTELNYQFDLERGPLFRAALITKNEAQHILLLSLHHIIFDGWSLNILLRDLFTIYEDILNKNHDRLPSLPIRFSDYVLWQKDFLPSEKANRIRNYWKRELLNHPATTEFASDLSRPACRSYQGASQSVDVNESVRQKMRDLCQRENLTPYMVLLAAFFELLKFETGRADLIVGGVFANRHHVGVQALIGLFANMLPLRIDLSKHQTFCSVVKSVRRIVLDAEQNQELPFEQIVRAVGCARDPSRMPFFQNVLHYQTTAPELMSEDKDLFVKPFSPKATTSKIDLEMVAIDSPSRMQLMAQYDAQLFTPKRIENLLTNYLRILETRVSNPD